VTPIPDGLDSAAAAPFRKLPSTLLKGRLIFSVCAGVTTYAALKRSNARPGQWVVIQGAGGGLGHLAVQIAARGMGLRVIGIDTGAKKDFVLGLGAEKFFDLTAQEPAELIKTVTEATASAGSPGLGAHAVIVCSNAMAAYEAGVSMLRRGGTLVCVGMPEGEPRGVAAAFPTLMVGKALTMVGNAVGNRADALEVLDMAARGIVKTKYEIEPMEKLGEVFEKLHDGKLLGRVVLELK
jgi:alcohol dehydrogenase, propanol-preferring